MNSMRFPIEHVEDIDNDVFMSVLRLVSCPEYCFSIPTPMHEIKEELKIRIREHQ